MKSSGSFSSSGWSAKRKEDLTMLRFLENIRDAWNAWLLKVGEANKKEFGDTVPDCCKMNRQDGQKR